MTNEEKICKCNRHKVKMDKKRNQNKVVDRDKKRDDQ
jgi:hypothetical protein